MTEIAAAHGLAKTGRTYRREVGEGAGLVLAYDGLDVGRGLHGFQELAWFLAIYPQGFAAGRVRVFGHDPRPFSSFSPKRDAPIVMSPPPRPQDPDRAFGYDNDDPADLEAFCHHLARWLEEAVPVAVPLVDPGRILDALEREGSMPFRDRVLRPMMSFADEVNLMVAAGRVDDALAALARLDELGAEDDGLRYTSLAARLRDVYPELRRDQPAISED